MLTRAAVVRVPPGSPLLTVDRTLVVEVVVEAVQARQRRGRERRARGLERWRKWQRALDDGTYASRAALARGEGVSRAAVTQGLRRLAEVMAADNGRIDR